MMAATSKALSEDDIAQIIEHMTEGLTLKQSCELAGVGYTNIITRIGKSETLKKLHACARDEYARFKVQAMHDIAKDEAIDVQRARLMVDCIKWEAARVLPKEFGDKIQQEHTGANGGAISYALEVIGIDPPKG